MRIKQGEAWECKSGNSHQRGDGNGSGMGIRRGRDETRRDETRRNEAWQSPEREEEEDMRSEATKQWGWWGLLRPVKFL